MTLNELISGQSAYISSVGGTGALRQHFLDMGIIPGAKIQLIKYAPMGDPIEFRIHSYELTLRVADAKKILIDENSIGCELKSNEINVQPVIIQEHPGFGEGGKYHVKSTEKPLP